MNWALPETPGEVVQSLCVLKWSLCNTEGLFLKSELCPPPAFLGNGYNGAIQKRISLPRPGRGNKNQGMEGRKGQFVVCERLYMLEMNHEADIAPAVAYVSTALYNELHLVVAGISWHFLWSSYGSLHTLGLEWCSILYTKVNIEAIHKNGSKPRANWCSGSGVYLGLGTSVLVPVRLVCTRVPLMVGSQVAASLGLDCTCRWQSQLQGEMNYQCFQPIHGAGFQLDCFRVLNVFCRTMILSAIVPTCLLCSVKMTVCVKNNQL